MFGVAFGLFQNVMSCGLRDKIWELGAGSWELGAGSWELGAGSWELGAARGELRVRRTENFGYR